MDIHETALTIRKWLFSCTNLPQIQLIQEIIPVFLTHRFLGHPDLPDSLAILQLSIREQTASVAPYIEEEMNVN